MLVKPEDGSNTVVIIGIDPGSSQLGIGAIEIDMDTFMITSSIAWTIVGEKLMPKNSWAEELHGARYVRINALQKELLRVFNSYMPNFIASESPFYNQRRPQAYGALTEVICAVRSAVVSYDAWRKLDLIDPPTVKNAVGAKGNADKDMVKKAISLIPELKYNGNRPLQELDEHSIDALAVAYCRYKQIRELLCLK